jgi:hypothetical protein
MDVDLRMHLRHLSQTSWRRSARRRRPVTTIPQFINLMVLESQPPHQIVNVVLIGNSKQKVDDFVGELTF